ncbi:hypothetical protein SAMN05444411_102432 [Lutibacter oricola]|uniref:Uncharacterized protein n=1 Tax=Lutibacter oricola TaxID=762486 RepID=A0A1H2XCF1_9FLAO|nr:hypothetical protein [Lutibacter oricola]SDW90495.1 hypothetical protein SAMN05444411_102432 [Lutibacter oricola]
MELANIEKLLEKYENAETSIAEENELKNYFLSNNVPEHLQEYQALFGYFSTSKQERYTKTIQLKSQKWNWKLLSVAASVILLVSIYGGHYKVQQNRAEKAYNESQLAFGMLSANLNKGTVAITQLQEFEIAKNKALKQSKK